MVYKYIYIYIHICTYNHHSAPRTAWVISFLRWGELNMCINVCISFICTYIWIGITRESNKYTYIQTKNNFYHALNVIHVLKYDNLSNHSCGYKRFTNNPFKIILYRKDTYLRIISDYNIPALLNTKNLFSYYFCLISVYIRFLCGYTHIST
jgi:hypothetical protein